jgi:putative ABC transport system substrate-binding protein
MRRRALIAMLGGTVALTLGSLRAGSGKSLPRIGILDPGIPHLFDEFVAAMSDMGYAEGQTITYIRRSAAGRADLIPQLAAELVNAGVDVIVTAAPLPVTALMKATSTIPIVFAALGDAIATGAVSSLAHPDRNATGLSFLNTEVSAKRMELLHELVPEVRRIAILSDSNTIRANLEPALAYARAIGLEARVFEVKSRDDFDAAFDAAAAAHMEAINVLASAFFNANRVQLTDLAARHRLPAMYETSEYVHSDGLMSYGPSLADLFRRAAVYVDKLLNGASPADLPVQQPTKFELVINLKTARTLGLAIPPSLLALADEVVE